MRGQFIIVLEFITLKPNADKKFFDAVHFSKQIFDEYVFIFSHHNHLPLLVFFLHSQNDIILYN